MLGASRERAYVVQWLEKNVKLRLQSSRRLLLTKIVGANVESTGLIAKHNAVVVAHAGVRTDLESEIAKNSCSARIECGGKRSSWGTVDNE